MPAPDTSNKLPSPDSTAARSKMDGTTSSTATSLPQQMEMWLSRAAEAIEAKNFKLADDCSRQALKLVSLGDIGAIKAAVSTDLPGQVPSEAHVAASQALSNLGISYGRLRVNYHLHAFTCFQHSVALNPSNLTAACNLSDLAVEVSETRFVPYMHRSERGWLPQSWSDEVQRQRTLAHDTLRALLHNHYGLQDQHMNGVLPIKTPKDPIQRAHLCWSLGNLAKLELKWAKDAPKVSDRRTAHLEEVKKLVTANFSAVGLPLDPIECAEIVLKKTGPNVGTNPWGAQTQNVAQGYNTLGSVYELSFKFHQAMDSYYLATRIDPNLTFSADRLTELREYNPSYDPAASLQMRVANLRSRSTPERVAAVPAITFIDLLKTHVSTHLPDPLQAAAATAGDLITISSSAWEAALSTANLAAILFEDPAHRCQLMLTYLRETCDEWWTKSIESIDGLIELTGIIQILDMIAKQDLCRAGQEARKLSSRYEDIQSSAAVHHGVEDSLTAVSAALRDLVEETASSINH